MLEVKILMGKMKAEGKVWDGKRWVNKETLYKRAIKNKVKNRK